MTSIGATGPFSLSPARTFRPKEGVRLEQRYKVRNDELDSFIASLPSGVAWSVSPVDNTPFSLVSVAKVDDDDPEKVLADAWSVSYNEEQLSVWELPQMQLELRKLGPEFAGRLRRDVEAYLAGETEVELTSGPTVPLNLDFILTWASSAGLDRAYVEAFITLLGRGVENFVRSLPVLRRVVTLPSNTSLKPVFSDIGSVYSLARLIDLEPTIPLNLRTALPPELGWVRKSPTADQTDSGKWQYVSEYWSTTYADPLLFPVVYE